MAMAFLIKTSKTALYGWLVAALTGALPATGAWAASPLDPLGDVAGAVRTDTLCTAATLLAGGAKKTFNPYMLGSNVHGKAPMGGTALADLAAVKPLNLDKRFSWGAGAEVLAGHSGKSDYMDYNAEVDTWQWHKQGPAPAWIQQLYAEIKFRGLLLTAGAKQRGSMLVDNSLSSGDLVHGVNARPVPQVRFGFVGFQNVPLTRGWVQIAGCLAFGKFADNNWLRHQYNRYNYHLATGTLYTYKNIYFRSNPAKPLTAVIGVQSAGMFGGVTKWYSKGTAVRTHDNPQGLKIFWETVFAGRGNGDGFVEGSHLGSWDARIDYNIGKRHRVGAYVQWLWEDGSSMGRRNKTDGLWGIEYKNLAAAEEIVPLRGAVAEYMDFRDQSGPMHWAPADNPGTDIVTEATGGDDYYNNTTFNAYANFGMGMGTSFLVSPLYNVDGFPQYAHTRSNGFHLAACGDVSRTVAWHAAVGYAQAWGNGRYHCNSRLTDTSAMVRATWDAGVIKRGLSASAAVAFDAGSLRGNNWGALMTLSYVYGVALKKTASNDKKQEK